MSKSKYKDGVYKSSEAHYFIKDGRIVMRIHGYMYKTNDNFMFGSFKEPLPEAVGDWIDKNYEELKSW